MNRIIRHIKKIIDRFQEHRLNAASAHAAFFIMLSFIPCIILLFSLLQFTSIEKTDVLRFVQGIVPTQMLVFVTGIVGEAYHKTPTAVSISALATIWSAGRGMMALTQGLQAVAGIREERNYFLVRLRAAFYTVVLLASILLFLLLGVFGNALLEMLVIKIPFVSYVAELIVDVKNIFLLLFATVIFALIYRFMPGNEMSMGEHLPGAILCSVGWFVYSHAFSIYVDKFSGFADVYGSLTTIILIMLWMYFGMYITLIGAEMNQMLEEWRKNQEKT